MPLARSPRAVRMWGVRCALDTAVARALGLTPSELETRLRSRSLAEIAADRGVPMPRLRQIAWEIAEPQLAAAVAAGVIDDHERTALHRRIEEKRGPWRDLASGRARTRDHGASPLSSSSARRAQALVGSEAGKVSSSSSSSFASASSSRVGGGSAVTRASRTTS
jgi:hypothetical protein